MHAGEEVGYRPSRGVGALLDGRPQLVGAGIEAESDRIAESAGDRFMAAAVGIVAVDGGAQFGVAGDEVAGGADGQVQLGPARSSKRRVRVMWPMAMPAMGTISSPGPAVIALASYL